MISPEENERWTRVAKGTPAGEMLRRYWWPVAFSDEIKGPRPKKVRLLAEDFVLFRDGKGQVGMLEPQCAHRRAAMQYGRVEDAGIRCCYHGWLWSTSGQCLETPCEEPDSTLKHRVKMAAYPVQELGGMVFVYIGPQPAPLLPKYDLLVQPSGTRYLYGTTNHCNWLQNAENAADLTHLGWLHGGPYPVYAKKRLQVDYVEKDYGFDYSITAPGVPAENLGSILFPCGNRIARGRVEQGGVGWHNIMFRVPRDDTTTLNLFLSYIATNDGKLTQYNQSPPDRPKHGPWMHTERGVYPAGDEDWWGVASWDQDRMVLESQGAIYDRTTETLAASDRGVALYRRMLRDAIQAVEEGRDPPGIVRDPSKNKVIKFAAHIHNFAPPLHQTMEPET
jgi:5,5'-dehydrodivanillate O-demethylase oxygenase subunit